ncbi:unnamed protein product [Notodromas monacha]|uniref:t-SNARE coiled-coil homology domain-containing protein n=1 Tax=Notodromas monacha TaxID=399045 RepID=A0A7R9GCI8_9CRUS|nr:unnamed protein product [Notodromas monacha]CAG0917481.1 unnamed protein product [Notodromas monacha]
MTKDRLAALIAAQGDDDDEAEPFAVEIPEGYMSEFFQEVEEVREQVEGIQEKVDRIKKIHSDLLTSPFEAEKKRAEREDIMQEIKRTCNKIRMKLKAIERKIEDDERVDNGSADLRIKKSQHSMLFRKFVDVMNDYNAALNDYSDRAKKRLKDQLNDTGKEVTDEEVDKLIHNGTTSGYNSDIIVDAKINKEMLQEIESRHEDLMRLETSIRELHDMFMDMAMLIENQGEMIDRIEYHVEHAKDYVARATEDMRKAKAYQDKARKKKLMMLACGVVVGSVLIFSLLGTFGL